MKEDVARIQNGIERVRCGFGWTVYIGEIINAGVKVEPRRKSANESLLCDTYSMYL